MRTNYTMADQNITMVSGDTLSFNVICKDQSGEPVTVDDATFKAKKNMADDTPVIDVSLGDGITQDEGVLTVRLSPSDTSYVGFLYYDMDITVGSDRFTLLRGMLQLEADV